MQYPGRFIRDPIWSCLAALFFQRNSQQMRRWESFESSYIMTEHQRALAGHSIHIGIWNGLMSAMKETRLSELWLDRMILFWFETEYSLKSFHFHISISLFRSFHRHSLFNKTGTISRSQNHNGRHVWLSCNTQSFMRYPLNSDSVLTLCIWGSSRRCDGASFYWNWLETPHTAQ